MSEFAACLDPACFAPAELVDAYDLPSTGGPVEVLATHCTAGHRYCGPRPESA